MTSLDRLSVSGRSLVDAAGRSVVLRGFVTITADQRGPVELDERNFDQMASWGCNVQQIRLEGSRLGVLETARDEAYLDKLERWITWGAERGMYSICKMTTYDVPSIGGPGNAFNPAIWQQFWDDESVRTDRIDAWRPVWERFAGRPEVLGYDILNEPGKGTNTPDIDSQNLFPFYEDVAVALRKIDTETCLMVQPATGFDGGRHSAQKMSDTSTVYAPHFYPDLFKELTDEEYDTYLGWLMAEGDQVGGPTVIGEFGLPNQFPNPRFRTCNPAEERRKGGAFDRAAMSAIRPWYVDEGWWAVMEPGYEEGDKLRAVIRPFLQRIPGSPSGWRVDDNDVLTTTLDVSIDAPLVIGARTDRSWKVEVDGTPADARTAGGTLEVDLPKGSHGLTVSPA